VTETPSDTAPDDRNAARAFFRGVIALSPMAIGGNLPYRRLCREFGADHTCSEMIFATKLLRGGEKPLLRHHASEAHFGVQLCGKDPAKLSDAAQIAVAAGARCVDLNFGCPIDVVVRRGAGAALLKRPRKLAELVTAVRDAIAVPLSVKIRSGYSEKKINAVEVALLAEAAGADAVGVHGRTRAQRYKRSADWGIVDAVADALTIPVLGNGDILTPWDLALRRQQTGVASFLIARGALIKPWIFTELAQGRAIQYTPPMRWRMMRRYYDHATEYLGDDLRGQQRVERFLLWHLQFWHRYRHYSEDDFQAVQPASLMQAREKRVTGTPDEVLLASADDADHTEIWRRVLTRDYPTDDVTDDA
jgi:tRNA-dihydrouridine synthase 3